MGQNKQKCSAKTYLYFKFKDLNFFEIFSKVAAGKRKIYDIEQGASFGKKQKSVETFIFGDFLTLSWRERKRGFYNDKHNKNMNWSAIHDICGTLQVFHV